MFRDNSKQGKHRNSSNKKRSTRKELRLIPLSEEIKREIMEPDSGSSEEKSGCGSGSGSGSDNVPLECIIELIRSEVRKYITELKLSDIFVRKTEFSSLCDLLGMKDNQNVAKKLFEEKKGENTMDEMTDEASDDLEQKEMAALSELENAFLAEQELDYSSQSGLGEKDTTNTSSRDCGTDGTPISELRGKPVPERRNYDTTLKSSLHIMFTMRNNFNDSENTPSERDSDRSDHSTYPNTVIKSLDSRLTVLEMKVSSLHRVLQRIQLLYKKDIKIQNAIAKFKERGDSTGRNSLDMRLQTCIDDEIEAIESDVQKSLFETDFEQRFFSDVKVNPYDELYYEWRQYRMNMMHYKKSHRSIRLNQRPKIQQFMKPPRVQHLNTNSGTKLKRRPGFVITPSRTKYKAVEACA